MANERAEEAETDGQRPDGGNHPARSLRRHGLTKPRAGKVRGLSHLSPAGAARMVDVSEKRETVRAAVARAVLKMAPATLRVIRRGNAPKGDVLGVARTAGILAAKRDRKSTRLNSSHTVISYAVFCLKKKNDHTEHVRQRVYEPTWLARDRSL